MMIRAGLVANDTTNEFRGYSLMELARPPCTAKHQHQGHGQDGRRRGGLHARHERLHQPVGRCRHQVDAQGYDEAEETFQSWTSVGNLPDFKAAKRVDLNTFPSLAQVEPGAEYKYATIGDRGETIQLATYGSLFSITRQAIVNDDLDVFTRLPTRWPRRHPHRRQSRVCRALGQPDHG